MITIYDYLFSADAQKIATVQTIKETRISRLRLLVKKYGGVPALSDKLGGKPSETQIRQILKEHVRSKSGGVYKMGDTVARRMEESLDLPVGWMDTPPSYAELHGEDDPVSKALMVMENIPKDQWPTVFRLIDAISQPSHQPAKTGTVG